MKTSIPEKKLLELAKKYGTPLYVYDGDVIANRYKELYEYFKWPGLKIYYAMKANYNIHILKILKELGSCIDAVSLGDVFFALKAGFNSNEILYTANNVTMDEIGRIKQMGILPNIESISTLEKFGETHQGSEICLRFNTDVVAGEHKFVVTGGDESKFGILIQDAEKAGRITEKFSLRVVGLHAHAGSGISDTEKVFQSMNNLLGVARKKIFSELEFIDFGGGFKVPYKPDEKRVDYFSFGKKTVELFSSFCSEYGKELQLYFEPGKFIVAESGYLLIEVNTLKKNKNHLIAGTNSGFSQLIRPVFYDAYHHIVNLTNPDGNEGVYDIYGNICESGDFFARDRGISQIREGDVLAIMNAGAYCYSMGSIYNLRPMPAEVIVKGESDWLSRKALTYEDMVSSILSEYQNITYSVY